MGSSLSWNGRQLTSNGNVQYIYDASGLRTVKYDSAQRTEYTYANGKLIYQETTFANGSTPVKLFFYYDSYGNLTGIKYNDAMFYAATNSQGDVIAIYHANGTVYARYEYDAWGNILSITDANGNAITSSTHIANVNPIRYRGYVYDTDTGLYYLQSRYYDPATGRFLNADGLVSTGQGVGGHNMFAYCQNNPVRYFDYNGCKPGDLFDSVDEAARDFAVCYNDISISENIEYATSIYQVKRLCLSFIEVEKEVRFWLWSWTYTIKKPVISVKVQYSYKKVNKGTSTGVKVPPVPLFKKCVATVHTHAAYDERYNNDSFSGWPGDKENAHTRGVPTYVATPLGTLRRYNPIDGSDVVVYDDIPWDPAHPERR